MTEVQQMISVFRTILQSNDTQQIAASQYSLNNYSSSHPIGFIMLVLEILQNNEAPEIKNLAILRLEKSLISVHSNKIWQKMPVEQQTHIQTTLFRLVKVQTDASVRGLLSASIGSVAGQYLYADPTSWPKLVENVYAFLQDNTDEGILVTLKILNSFLMYSAHVFDKRGDELYSIFKNAFGHHNNKIKENAIKAFCAFLTMAGSKGQQKMQHLIVPFFEVSYGLIVNDNFNVQGLELIADLVEVFPRMVKIKFKQFNQLFKNVMEIKGLSDGSKRIATQSMITLAEKYPQIFIKTPGSLVSLIEAIFRHMIQIDQEINKEWQIPKEGFCQDIDKCEEFESTSFGTLSLDRLITAIGEKQLVPIVSIAIQKMLQMDDWRCKFAALMALSEVGDHVGDIDDLKSIVEMLFSYLSNPNPMVRFAALHSIGQTADDQRPEFQQIYGRDTFLKIAPMLQDTVPRVVSHAAASLSNVIEEMQYCEIESHVGELMNLLLTLATTSISLVKTSALTVIASIAMTGKDKFIPFFQKTSEILFLMIDQHKGKQYKDLKGTIIDTLTTLAHSIGKQAFKSTAPRLIQYLVNIQENDLDDIDPQKQYLLDAWQKLATIFGTDIGFCLPRVLPGLFIIVEKIIEKKIQSSTLQSIQLEMAQTEAKINTSQTQQAESAIAMLNIFMQQCKKFYLPYSERTSTICLAIIKSEINEDIKLQALIGLPVIVNLVKQNSQEGSVAYAKNFLSILVDACHNTHNADLMQQLVESMEEIFKCFGDKFLHETQLTEFSTQIIKLLIKSKDRKDASNKMKDEIENIEDDEIAYYSQQLDGEDEVQVALSNLIGQILKTHKEMNLPLVQYILHTELPRVFVEGASSKMIKFGIFLVDDIVDHLGYKIMQSQWNAFGQVFIRFLLDKNCAVRQAASYGLGSYSEKTPGEVFQPMLKGSLDLLVKSLTIPKTDSQKVYKACTDNIVSAIGKIIRTHGQFIKPRPYLSVWLQSLPLKVDHVEAITQHAFLTEIILNDQTLLIPDESEQSLAILSKILTVFGEIVKTKVSKEQVNQNIKLCLNKLKTMPFFYSNSDRLWADLTEKQAKKLTNLLKL